MIVLDHAPYTPFDHPRTVGPPGLNPMDMADWTVVHPDFPAQMAYRETLLVEEVDTVMACDPAAHTAVQELLDEMLGHLGARADYRLDGDTINRPDGVSVQVDRTAALLTLGRLVAEDLCVLLPDAQSGEYRLMAAVLCFPSRWLLSEKMHRPLTAIHDPVPDYDDVLARRVNRVFETLRPGRALVRCNWLVHGDPELHRPIGREGSDHDRTEQSDAGLFLRTERQSLVRLPRTGAVVFAIKTSVSRLDSLSGDKALALSTALGDLGAETLEYSERGDVHAVAIAQLRQHVDRDRPTS